MNPTLVTTHLWQCTCGQLYTREETAAACCVCRRCGCANARHARHVHQLCSDCWQQHRASRVANVPVSLYEETEFSAHDDPESNNALADNFKYVCEMRGCPEGCDASHGAYAITRCPPFRLSAEDILGGVSGEWPEFALEDVDAEDLQARLDEWCEAEDVTGWWVDGEIRVLPDDVCRRWVDALEAFTRWLAS